MFTWWQFYSCFATLSIKVGADWALESQKEKRLTTESL
jgi:hypothetical protein